MAQSILRLPAVKVRTGLSRSEIYRRMAAGAFPRTVDLSPNGRAVGWASTEIDQWVERTIREGRPAGATLAATRAGPRTARRKSASQTRTSR